jgi:transposase
MFKRLIPKPAAPLAAILACTIGATAFGDQTDAEKKKAEAAAEYLKAHGWAVQKPGEAKKSEASIGKRRSGGEEGRRRGSEAARIFLAEMG